ncbi:MAG: CpsB/CapC family capsule biosynthesis tyrosine phosphatase [Lachnospiraceae bacterium]
MESTIRAMQRNKFGICDLHCHILPGMDDGCRSVEESIRVMEESGRQGVGAMIATPHYYPRETVESFLSRRHVAYSQLHEKMKEKKANLPVLSLGAEVAWHNGLIYEERLEELCFGKSNYMLLEMPFAKWSSGVLSDVRKLGSMCNIRVIIAHLERYLKIQDKRMIEELLDLDVMIQMNGEYILGFWTQWKAAQMLRNGIVQVLGSDTHNMAQRSPNLGETCRKLSQMRLDDVWQDIQDTSAEIFQESIWGRRD